MTRNYVFNTLVNGAKNTTPSCAFPNRNIQNFCQTNYNTAGNVSLTAYGTGFQHGNVGAGFKMMKRNTIINSNSLTSSSSSTISGVSVIAMGNYYVSGEYNASPVSTTTSLNITTLGSTNFTLTIYVYPSTSASLTAPFPVTYYNPSTDTSIVDTNTTLSSNNLFVYSTLEVSALSSYTLYVTAGSEDATNSSVQIHISPSK